MTKIADSVAALKHDKIFAPLIKKYGEPQLSRYYGGTHGVFPSLLRSIIYQQLSGHAARAIHGRVLALFPGEKAEPATFLKIRAPRLRKAGLSIAKINYARDLARKCLDGTIDEKKFPKMSSEEIIEHLCAVKGIGPWTAHMYLLFTMQRPDILPVGDLGVRKGFQKLYKLPVMPNAKQMEQLARPWRAHASAGSWYMWRLADESKPQKKG